MKKLERILWCIVGLALVLKVLRLPASSVLLILSLSSLAMLYFWLSWLVFPKPERKDQIWAVSFLAGTILSVAVVGILYKLQIWPFSAFFLLLGGTGLLLLVAALLVIHSTRADLVPYSRGLLTRSVPMLVVCTALYVLPDATLTAFYYRHDQSWPP